MYVNLQGIEELVGLGTIPMQIFGLLLKESGLKESNSIPL
jgi:hypothetical protein